MFNMPIWLGSVIAIIAFVIAMGYRYYYPLATDNDVVEKVCEEVIEKETGIDIKIDKKN